MHQALRWIRICGLAATVALLAQDAPRPVPPEQMPFVVPGMRFMDSVTADLDGDGRRDVLLLLETTPSDEEGESAERIRSLRILLRQADGELKLVKQNDKAVYCSSCGGVMGDPYGGITAKAKGFAIVNEGGSRERWANTYVFGYSRRDKTWQLVKAIESTWDTLDPKAGSRGKPLTPPRDFGKIDFEDFDPDDYKGVGPR